MSASTLCVMHSARSWTRLLVPDGFAFVESINKAESTRDLPDKWYTLDFLPGVR